MEYSTIIRKKNKGYQYVITYKVNGVWKQKSKQGFAKKGEAQIAMDKMIPILEKMVKNNVTADKVTLKNFYETYRKRMCLYREVNTILNYDSAMNKFNDILELELSKININDIQNCIDKMTYDGMKTSSIYIYIRILKTVFKSAKNDYNLISDIPSFDLKIRNDKNKPNKKALSNEEIETLLNEMKTSRYYLMVFVALKTGMRYSEVLGLTWDNVNLVNKTITVNKQWKKLSNGKWGLGELKSKNSYRIIPIPQSLIKELKKAKVKSSNKNERLFNYVNNNTRLNYRLKRHGITFHELRHTYATNLIAKGVDLKTTAYLLGHDIKETMATYSHVNNDMINNATKIIEENL